MGSNSSKFRKHLQNGDEVAACHLWNTCSDLRKNLNPNSSYGDSHNHDTPLHLVSRYAVKSLLRVFLKDYGGNPNKRNARNETCLHNVCMPSSSVVQDSARQQRRYECLLLILQWHGSLLQDGTEETIDIGFQDEKMNTALHYAASAGLGRCVEVLIAHGSPLFVENCDKQTPCDCAEKAGHSKIALYLESKMVFSSVDDTLEDVDVMLDQIEAEEGSSGLRAQDLREAKDQLLVETSDMLQVPLFTAEALLRNHEWSREMLLEAWMTDPIACCQKCGVMPPAHLYNSSLLTETVLGDHLDLADHSPAKSASAAVLADVTCDICTTSVLNDNEPPPMACGHQFCKHCWEKYLTGKIEEGEAHNITCPGFQCSMLVPVDMIEKLVSRDMARRFLQFDIKAFVESNPHIKWCPMPGCGQAVRLPETDLKAGGAVSPIYRGMNEIFRDFSRAVDCGRGHVFCWDCLGEAHEPVSCDNWKKWHLKVGEVKPEELSGTADEVELAANYLWLVTNSKPCPNCKSPIQKHEGCNHMKCSKCKHDFCWVCLEPWKKHSSSTGGYFRCNRYEVVKKVEENQEILKSDAENRNKRMQELDRFMHYYTRFKNHENSFKLEEPLLGSAKHKMEQLARLSNSAEPDSPGVDTKFVEESVTQLLKARRVLRCSYVYGFYLEDTGFKKPIFEFMQTELEECTESLSEMVARLYLRTPRPRIVHMAQLVQRKRHELLTAIEKGLVPPDNSPSSRKREIDEDLRRALLASIQDSHDPRNPWVKDPSGKHTNVAALLDWPVESDESDDEENHAAGGFKQTDSSVATPGGSTEPLPPKGPEMCIRPSCRRKKAESQLTKIKMEYCSMRCMRAHQLEQVQESERKSSATETYSDFELNLLRGLEMSRLQFLQEMGQCGGLPSSGDRSPRSPIISSSNGTNSARTSFLEACSPIVLNDPPPGRISPSCRVGVGAPSSSASLNRPPSGVLNGSVANLEEEQLRLAIELSLQDICKTPATHNAEAVETEDSVPTGDLVTPCNIALQFANAGECNDVTTSCENVEVTTLVSSMVGTNILLSKQNDNNSEQTNDHRQTDFSCNVESPPSSLNSFGIIKDISVSNLYSGDIDKVKDFKEKDFSSAFLKTLGGKESSGSSLSGGYSDVLAEGEGRNKFADMKSNERYLPVESNVKWDIASERESIVSNEDVEERNANAVGSVVFAQVNSSSLINAPDDMLNLRDIQSDIKDQNNVASNVSSPCSPKISLDVDASSITQDTCPSHTMVVSSIVNSDVNSCQNVSLSDAAGACAVDV